MSRLAFLAVALATGCFAARKPGESAPLGKATSESPSAFPGEVKPTGFGAVSYFEEKCARCHGPQGSFFPSGFAKDQDAAKLTASTKQMCDGPGGAPLKDDDLKVEVAYMRAISEGKPFIVWTSDEGALKGETSVEKLAATVDGKSVTIEVKDGAWSLPKGGKVILSAGEDQKAVRLALDEGNVSQSVSRNATE